MPSSFSGFLVLQEIVKGSEKEVKQLLFPLFFRSFIYSPDSFMHGWRRNVFQFMAFSSIEGAKPVVFCNKSLSVTIIFSFQVYVKRWWLTLMKNMMNI